MVGDLDKHPSNDSSDPTTDNKGEVSLTVPQSITDGTDTAVWVWTGREGLRRQLQLPPVTKSRLAHRVWPIKPLATPSKTIRVR